MAKVRQLVGGGDGKGHAQCKQIVMLPGWRKSNVALTERAIAKGLSMPIKYLHEDNGGFFLSDYESADGDPSR